MYQVPTGSCRLQAICVVEGLYRGFRASPSSTDLRRAPRRPGTAKVLPTAQARAGAQLRGPTDPEESRSRERPGCASGLLRSPGIYLVPRPDSNAHVPPAGKAGRACTAWQAARASFAKGHRGALMTVSWGSQHMASPNGE